MVSCLGMKSVKSDMYHWALKRASFCANISLLCFLDLDPPIGALDFFYDMTRTYGYNWRFVD